MSTLKVNAIRGTGASSDAISVNATDGTCTARITNNLSNRNLIINGAMNVAQRGTSFTNIGSAGDYDDTYTLDRFLISQGLSAGRCSVTQESDAPSGFSKSLKIATTTADTSIAAGEYHRLLTKFEGQDLQRFAKGTSDAKQFTLSFYCKANASATYVAELHDTDNNRTISKTYSVTTSWTRVELTFAADTTGAFTSDNLLSLELCLWFHAGSTYSSGTLQTNWGSITAANRAVGIDSIFDSTNRTFFITGVQLEVGSTATDFEHKSYGYELARCQRYFFRLAGDSKTITTGHQNGAYGIFPITYPQTMRAAPSATAQTVTDAYSYYYAGTVARVNSVALTAQNERYGNLDSTSYNTTDGTVGLFRITNTSAYIDINAEL